MAKHIPEDVIIKILERLPVKSLIRFTCVSKLWRFIILSDPNFAKSHYKLCCEDQTITRKFLLSTSVKYELDLVDFDESSSCVRKTRLPFEQPGIKSWSFPCSCNGLVCAVVSIANPAKPGVVVHHMYIWNPSTGFLKQLPDPSMEVYLNVYGFGYLPATDDYKIIKPGEIISLKANVWRTIQVPFSYFFKSHKECIRANEALHWFYYYNLDERKPCVIAFDLAIEEFRTMLLPAALEHKCMYRGGSSSVQLVASSEGYLCAVCYDNRGGCIDLWVMGEYGVAESWTKLFNFEVSSGCKIFKREN